jgi:hypothetical protein
MNLSILSRLMTAGEAFRSGRMKSCSDQGAGLSEPCGRSQKIDEEKQGTHRLE